MSNSSEVDWESRMAEVQLDLNAIWRSSTRLKEAPVGGTGEERLLDAVFHLPRRDNEHVELQIVPIKNADALNPKVSSELVIRNQHMFKSRLWQLIAAYYNEHNCSFRGLVGTSIVQEVRVQINEALKTDDTSIKIYQDSLTCAVIPVFTSLANALADEVLRLLSGGNRESALAEARRAYFDGELHDDLGHTEDAEEPTDDDILLVYTQSVMYKLLYK